MQKYMPSSAKLVDIHPEIVENEPTNSGTPRRGVIPLGNGSPRLFAFALDELAGKDARIDNRRCIPRWGASIWTHQDDSCALWSRAAAMHCGRTALSDGGHDQVDTI